MAAAGGEGMVIGGGFRGGGEGAAVEGGDNAEGDVEGAGQVGNEGVEGEEELLLRLAAGRDGVLHLLAHLLNGGDVIASVAAAVLLWFHVSRFRDRTEREPRRRRASALCCSDTDSDSNSLSTCDACALSRYLNYF